MTGQSMTGKDNVLATNIDGLGIELYQGEGTGNRLILGSGSSGYGYEVINALSEKMLRGRRSRLQQKYIRLKVLQLIAGSLVPVHL